jgi:DNA repair exonuclease SbcCD ATPase subunit
MPSSATDDLIRRLYESPPDGFVAARTAAVNEARKTGDRDTAKRLAALKKPTVAAWVVNLLALRRPELIEELVELSGALREAQRGLKGDQLRELTAQRRQVISALVAAARQLAQAEEPGIKLPLGEVEATLSAALAEPDVAAQVRTGRLIRSATYAGFGEVPRPRLRLVTDDPDEDTDEEPEDAGEAEVIELPHAAARENAASERERLAAERRRREYDQRKRDLRRELGMAESAEQRADRQVEKAEAAERDAGNLVEDLDAELAELERRRTEAQADVARRKLARRTAEREAAAARRRVGDVQAALEDLEASMPD